MATSVIHYRFKNGKEWESLTFEGSVLAALELKRCIVAQKGLNNSVQDFDLLLTNAQTGEDYRDDGYLVPKNSSVVVRRVPATRASTLKIQAAPLKLVSPDAVVQTQESQADSDAMLAVVQQAQQAQQRAPPPPGHEEYSQQYRGFGGGGGGVGGGGRGPAPSYGADGQRQRFNPQSESAPPPTYVCHRCGEGGHYIKSCPTNNDPEFNYRKHKAPVGIPRSFLQEVDDPKALNEDPNQAAGGTMLLPGGGVAVARPNDFAFKNSMSAMTGSRVAVPQHPVPTQDRFKKEFICGLCNQFLQSASCTPCCHTSFCDECVRQELSGEAGLQCPVCAEPCQLDALLRNVILQRAVDKYRSANPQITAQRVAQEVLSSAPSGSSSSSAVAPPPIHHRHTHGGGEEEKRHHREDPHRRRGGGRSPPPDSRRNDDRYSGRRRSRSPRRDYRDRHYGGGARSRSPPGGSRRDASYRRSSRDRR